MIIINTISKFAYGNCMSLTHVDHQGSDVWVSRESRQDILKVKWNTGRSTGRREVI